MRKKAQKSSKSNDKDLQITNTQKLMIQNDLTQNNQKDNSANIDSSKKNNKQELDFNRIVDNQQNKFPQQQQEPMGTQQLKQIILGQFNLLQTQKQDLFQQLQNKLNQIKQKALIKAKSTKIDGMIVGIWIGISIAMFVLLIIIVQIFNLSILDNSKFSVDFPVWRGVGIYIFYVWVLGVSMWLFQKYKLNFKQILNFAENHHPEAVNVFKFAGFHTTVFLLLFLFYIFAYTEIYQLRLFAPEYFALACWVIFFGTLCLPVPIFSHKGRFYVLKLIISSFLSPLTGLSFSALLTIDQFISMAIPLKDTTYTFCYYINNGFQSANVNICKDANGGYSFIILSIVVNSLKIFQCIRQGYDNKKYFLTPSFYNSIKFSCIIITTILSFQYKLGLTSVMAPWLLFTFITTLYAYAWDIQMDWGLFEKNHKYPFLREVLVLPYKKVYYGVIVLNFFMRCSWILSLSPAITNLLGNANLVSLLVGMVQIIRRGIWNFFKLQYQHVKRYSKQEIIGERMIYKKKKKLQSSYKKLQIKLIRFYQQFKNDIVKKQHQNTKQIQNCQKLQKKEMQYRQTHNKYSTPLDEQQMDQISQLVNEVYELDPKLRKTINLDIKRSTMLKSKRQTMKQNLNITNHKSIQIQLLNRTKQI